MTIHLVDASGLIHRAFHAIRGLRTRQGLPVNALYGLSTMLRKFVREWKPERCAVVFDAGRETFRNEMFEGYKANRPPADPDLAVQFPYARRVAEAFGFPVLEVPGFEADDIIATLTRRARSAGMDVVIQSGDKDLLQLVGDGVRTHDPMRDKTFDRAAVIEKMGVPPELIRDWLALVGDSSDNVPGVAGIGAKGATELVASVGGLDALYSNLDRLSPRHRDALVAGRDSAYLSRDLVTLRDDVSLPVQFDDLRMREPDSDSLVALLSELEFRSLLEEIGRERPGVATASAAPAGEPVSIQTGSWESAVAALGEDGSVSIAAVYGARDPSSPDCRGLALAAGAGKVFVLRPETLPEAFFHAVAGELGRRPFNCAHFKELHQVFAARGVDLPLPAMEPVLASYLLNAERESHSLETVALEVLGRPVPPASESSDEALAARALATRDVSARLDSELADPALRRLLGDVEIPLARVLACMEKAGVPVDPAALSGLSRSLASDLQRLEKDILEAAGMPFNPASPKQLADVLFGKLQLPVIKKTKSGPSTDVTVLEELADRHPVPALILEYRSLAKLKGTYADALAGLINSRTGRIHTSYNQAVTATGRLSSSDPNLQNIPIRTEAGRKIRAAFRALPGSEFVSADYSQIELRVLAHLSGDESMLEGFRQGIDIHARTAARIFGVAEADVTPDMRRTAKVVNFGILYGMGPFRLARDLKISQAEGQRIIKDYFGAFPRIRTFLDSTLESARDKGFVSTASGRRRSTDGLRASNHNERAAAERMALNMPIQGTAADIIKVAMVRLHDALGREGLDSRLVLQVHDELVLEVPDGEGDRVSVLLKETMESAWSLNVPLVVEVGRGHAWSDLHG